ncbi:MAG: hypothetical protein QXX08_05040, partial [Candidatus Bathyarchaeia archaeon]
MRALHSTTGTTLFLGTTLVFVLLCATSLEASYNTSLFPIGTAGNIFYGDFMVYKDKEVFRAENVKGGEVFSNKYAFVTINYAIKAISSGTVYIMPGTYPIGLNVVISKDANWVSTKASVSINNSVPGMEGVATQINIPYPAPTGLIAYYNFPAPLDLSLNYSLGFWFKPSTALSSKEATGDYGGSPLKFLLDDSLNCTSPIYSEEIWHPEWVTNDWKYCKIPGTPPAGKTLPKDLAKIRSIGIEIWSNPNCITPSTTYSVMIDDVHAHGGEIRIHRNIRLVGAGANETT